MKVKTFEIICIYLNFIEIRIYLNVLITVIRIKIRIIVHSLKMIKIIVLIIVPLQVLSLINGKSSLDFISVLTIQELSRLLKYLILEHNNSTYSEN